MNIDTLLYDHRLFIDGHYENLAGLFCNIAGQKTSLTKERFLLSSWYEGYLYNLLLGIRINQRQSFVGKRVDKAPKWSNNYLKQYQYIIAILLSKKEILNELKIIDYQSVSLKDRDIKSITDDLKKICDEYSNGGLLYLSRLYEKDNTVFNEYDSLTRIMANVIKDNS